MADDDAPTGPSISMFPDGPIQVDGPVPLVRQDIVVSEDGEPLTYRTTAEVADGGRYFLCRCGGSGNKPFCDGSHKTVGFSSDEVDLGTYAERSRSVGGTRVEVHDDRKICVHAGFCGDTVTNVWKMAGPADDDARIRARMITMIENCPSGALTYELQGTDRLQERRLPTEISVLADGPLAVTGGIPVTNSAGEALETRNRVTLCRCGASSTKPLCDGSHKEAGFADS